MQIVPFLSIHIPRISNWSKLLNENNIMIWYSLIVSRICVEAPKLIIKGLPLWRSALIVIEQTLTKTWSVDYDIFSQRKQISSCSRNLAFLCGSRYEVKTISWGNFTILLWRNSATTFGTDFSCIRTFQYKFVLVLLPDTVTTHCLVSYWSRSTSIGNYV